MESWFAGELEKIAFKVEQGVLAGWHLSVTAAQDLGSDLKKLLDHNSGVAPLKPGSITPHPIHAQQMAEAAAAGKPAAGHAKLGTTPPVVDGGKAATAVTPNAPSTTVPVGTGAAASATTDPKASPANAPASAAAASPTPTASSSPKQ